MSTSLTAGSDGRILSAHAAAWEGNRGSLDEHLRTLGAVGELGRSIEANRLSLRAAHSAIEGRVDEAATGFRQARRAFSELDLPGLEGLSAMDAAYTLPADHPEAAEARSVARRIFESPGAKAMISQLDALQPDAADAMGASEVRHQTSDDAIVVSESA